MDAAKKSYTRLLIMRVKKNFLLYYLLLKEEEKSYAYDEATLAMLHERSEQYLSGKTQSYTIEQSLKRIESYRIEKLNPLFSPG